MDTPKSGTQETNCHECRNFRPGALINIANYTIQKDKTGLTVENAEKLCNSPHQGGAFVLSAAYFSDMLLVSNSFVTILGLCGYFEQRKQSPILRIDDIVYQPADEYEGVFVGTPDYTGDLTTDTY